MKKRINLKEIAVCLALFSLIFALNSSVKPAQATTKKSMIGIKELYSLMEKAMVNKDKAAFKALWHIDGFFSNPTGKSGYSGEMAYKDGTRYGWYIKPDFKKLLQHGLDDVVKGDDVVILPSHIWSYDKHKAIRDIYTAVVRQGDHWLVLGLSNDSHELQAMVDRFKNPWTPE